MSDYSSFTNLAVLAAGLVTGLVLLSAAIRVIGRAPTIPAKIICCLVASLGITGLVCLMCQLVRWLLGQLPGVLLLIFVLFCLPGLLFRRRRW